MYSREAPSLGSQIDARPPSSYGSHRPPSSRVQSARRTRPLSANRGPAPIKHEPCSSTLAKFHDGVNFSLLEPHSNKRTVQHPVLEAKEKFKYMSRHKSYCDESLFASNTPRAQSIRHDNQFIGNHVTHDYMSNQTPLAFNAPIKSARLNSARSVISQQDMSLMNNELPRASRPEKPYVKPWR